MAQALHWFDFDRFYTEVGRVLTPNGVIAVWAYGINTVEGDDANQLVQDFYAKTVGPHWPPEGKLVEAGYRIIPFPYVEVTPPAFRMEARWTLNQLLGYFSTWSATNRFLKATGHNPLETLAPDLKRVWSDADSPRLVVWPLSEFARDLRLGAGAGKLRRRLRPGVEETVPSNGRLWRCGNLVNEASPRNNGAA